jgi:hypothetical protein
MKNTLILRWFSLLLLSVGAARAASGDMTTLAIAAGQGHALALRSDGTVWAWGENAYGPLGVPSVGLAEFPLRVAGLSNIVSVAAGADHSLAVQANGTVWAWGANDSGQLGTGNYTWSTVPVQVVGITNAVAVAGGGYEGYGSHSLVFKRIGHGLGIQWIRPVRQRNLHDESNACCCAWIEQRRADQGRRI